MTDNKGKCPFPFEKKKKKASKLRDKEHVHHSEVTELFIYISSHLSVRDFVSENSNGVYDINPPFPAYWRLIRRLVLLRFSK